MLQQKRDTFREHLRNLAVRVEGTAATLEEDARTGTGGASGGNLSNTPLHLGDLGSETYSQELSAALLENEVYMHDEIRAALDRVEKGTFGTCESCGVEIPEARLTALPYARYCAPCAERLQAGLAVNFNAGRAGDRPGLVTPPDTRPEEDSHAAGTAGGGTAVGGLAGTNVGRGDPDNADLEAALGSGSYDTALDGGDEGEGYAGQAGGAVGGTPAGKRVTGGKAEHGISPRPGPGESPIGQ
jgi:RNA polymerase-binding transcription factor DksA